MSAAQKNELKITQIGPNKWELDGKLGDRKRFRKQGANLAKLQAAKAKEENEYQQELLGIKSKTEVHQSWLTTEQIRDAETACRKLPPGRTLEECVDNAVLTLGSGLPMDITETIQEWKSHMERRRLSTVTITKGVSRLKAFVAWGGFKLLPEITSNKIEAYCCRTNAGDYTRLGDARVLSTYLNFCLKETWLKQSPLKLDLPEMARRAKPTEEPEILTPEQAQSLLSSACASGRPGETLFTVLSVFLFMRRAEVLRFTPDQIITDRGQTAIHVRGHKLGSRWRNVPIPERLLPLVNDCIKHGAMGPDLKNPVLQFSEIYWKAIRENAGLLKLEPSLERSDRMLITDSNWDANILRHTGMSYLFQETGDANLVTTRAGNSVAVAFLHYLRRAKDGDYLKFNSITGSLKIEVADNSAQSVA